MTSKLWQSDEDAPEAATLRDKSLTILVNNYGETAKNMIKGEEDELEKKMVKRLEDWRRS